jgi:hypothetical protein
MYHNLSASVTKPSAVPIYVCFIGLTGITLKVLTRQYLNKHDTAISASHLQSLMAEWRSLPVVLYCTDQFSKSLFPWSPTDFEEKREFVLATHISHSSRPLQKHTYTHTHKTCIWNKMTYSFTVNSTPCSTVYPIYTCRCLKWLIPGTKTKCEHEQI